MENYEDIYKVSENEYNAKIITTKDVVLKLTDLEADKKHWEDTLIKNTAQLTAKIQAIDVLITDLKKIDYV